MTWNPPEPLVDEPGTLYNYVIKWSINWADQEDIFVTQAPSYTFKNLKPGNRIYVRVRATSTDGKREGGFSEDQRLELSRG